MVAQVGGRLPAGTRATTGSDPLRAARLATTAIREGWVSARKLLAQYGLKPQKSLGQNFLTDKSVLSKIVAAAQLKPDDEVLEVGPGLGHLTRLLVQQAKRVVAVELDAWLIPVLQDQLAGLGNVELIQGDILEQPLDAFLLPPDYKVVANLPFYITSAVLEYFLSGESPPARMVVTVQHEVAQRIVARPGTMSLLAVSVQLYGQPRVVARVKAGAFYPRPEVDAAVVCIDRHSTPPASVQDSATFFAVVKAGFAQRRKQLRNSLTAGLNRSQAEVVAGLEAAGVDPRRRPETLSLPEWAAIANRLNNAN
ncbi:MAG: ribosomal RNA small subunit methyltransferase A [Anaerolineae bacterium]|nr:MAG: ribosomal RNA small subunit methyltransferase A [Anaerolineae bacterium]